jgi:prepilin signal peptidase PulO-like enzyme (type II secretory pathway)
VTKITGFSRILSNFAINYSKSMKEKSLGSAILKGKCPQCREGDIFPTSIFSYSKLTEVNHRCPHCQAVLVPEPDFFYGAMYISYAFSVALVVNVLIILNLFFEDPEISVYIITVIISNIILLPLMLRYSKVLYLYWLGKLQYDPLKAKK